MNHIRKMFARHVVPAAALVALAIGSSEAFAVGINDYQLTRSFLLPEPGVFSGGNVLLRHVCCTR
jgi:hypothetical protein